MSWLVSLPVDLWVGFGVLGCLLLWVWWVNFFLDGWARWVSGAAGWFGDVGLDLLVFGWLCLCFGTFGFGFVLVGVCMYAAVCFGLL